MTTVMETLTGLLQEYNAYLNSPEGKEMMAALGEAISGFFTDLSKIDPEQVLEGLKDILDKIKKAFEWLIENKQGVVDAMKWIIGGWAGLKLAGGGLQVYNMLKGLQLMHGGGGAEMASAAGAGAAAGASAFTGNSLLWGGAGAAKLFGLGEAATAALLLYPMYDKIKNEGWDSINPFGEKLNQPSLFGKTVEALFQGRSEEAMEELQAFADAAGTGIIDDAAHQRNTLRRVWNRATGLPVEYENVPGSSGGHGFGGGTTESAAEAAESFADALRDSNSELADVYDTLTDYTTLSGDLDKMNQLAQDFFDWWEGDASNSAMDEFIGLMDDSQFAEWLRSMEQFRSGEGALGGDVDAYLDPMRTALSLIEGYMEQESKKDTLTREDVVMFRELPKKLQDAVRTGAESANLTVSGVVADAIGRRTRKGLWDDVFTYTN